MWQQTGQREASIPLAEEAATLCRSLADRSGEARALDQLGQAYLHMARWRESLAYFEEARMLYGAAADQGGVADALSRSGIVCWNLGRHPEAESRMRQALALYRDDRGPARPGEGADQPGPGPLSSTVITGTRWTPTRKPC